MKLIGSPFIRKESFGNEIEPAEFINTKYFNPNPCFGINHGVTNKIGVWILNLIPLIVIFIPIILLFKKPVKVNLLDYVNLSDFVVLPLIIGIVLFVITQIININALPCDKDSYIAKNGDIYIIRDKNGLKVEGGITDNMNKLSFNVETKEKDDAGKFKIETYALSHEDVEQALKNNNDVQDALFETSEGKTKLMKIYKTKK